MAANEPPRASHQYLLCRPIIHHWTPQGLISVDRLSSPGLRHIFIKVRFLFCQDTPGGSTDTVCDSLDSYVSKCSCKIFIKSGMITSRTGRLRQRVRILSRSVASMRVIA